jgi:hypothetical protein
LSDTVPSVSYLLAILEFIIGKNIAIFNVYLNYTLKLVWLALRSISGLGDIAFDQPTRLSFCLLKPHNSYRKLKEESEFEPLSSFVI